MFSWLRHKKLRLNMRKVQAGDRHPLKKYKRWHLFTRSLFHLTITSDQREKVHYEIGCKYFVEEPRADLYRDGKYIASSKLPAAFPVLPDRLSIRGLRLRLDNQCPRTSNLLGFVSVVLLVAALVLELPQLIEIMTQIPWIAENVGAFVSPIEYSF